MNCKKCDRLQAEVDELWRYRKRAEKAEQELDEVRATMEEYRSLATRYADELMRALTPDAITDEMIERALPALRRYGIHGSLVPHVAREMLAAALTESPARPEWDALRDVLSRTHRPPTTDELTDVLYAEGVRAMGGN